MEIPLWIVFILMSLSGCLCLVLGAMLASNNDDYKRGREDMLREILRDLDSDQE